MENNNELLNYIFRDNTFKYNIYLKYLVLKADYHSIINIKCHFILYILNLITYEIKLDCIIYNIYVLSS